MSFVLGKPIFFDFTLHNPKTGNVQDADMPPIAKVYEDDRVVPIHLPPVAKRGYEIGSYFVRIDTTKGNEFELDKSYNVIVEATVEGITAKARVAQFTLDEIPLHTLANLKYELIRPTRGSREEVWVRKG